MEKKIFHQFYQICRFRRFFSINSWNCVVLTGLLICLLSGKVSGQDEIRTFGGTTLSVRSAAFSPDGTKVLTGCNDYTAKLWNTATGAVIRTFIGHTKGIDSVAFSPDGRRVLTGSDDNTAKLWDATTGLVIRTFSGHLKSVTSVAFSQDGTKVLTGSGDTTAKLWDAATGLEICTFIGHTTYVSSVAFSPDGTKVLTGSYGKTAKLWDATTGLVIRTFSGHADCVTSVAFSPDGRRVLTGSDDNTAKLWDATTGLVIRTFRGHSDDVTSVAFSPDGTKVLTGSEDSTAKLWNEETGTIIRTFSGNSNNVYHVAFSPDGTKLLTVSSDHTARLWNAATGAIIRTLGGGHWLSVNSVAFSPDGEKILTGSGDDTAILWDTTTGVVIHTFSGHTMSVNSVAFSPDGEKILTGSDDNTAKLWDVATGTIIRTFSGHTNSVVSVAFSPDGRRVLTGSYDNTAKLWDATTGVEINTFNDTVSIHSVAFSPDGTKVLMGSSDMTAKLWDVATGIIIRTFSGHTNSVVSVAFSPDGTRVLTGSRGGDAIKLWDATTGVEIRTLSDASNGNGTNTVVFSPDGTRVLTTGGYKAKLWDTETGVMLCTFSGHTNYVNSAAFSPDGMKVVTGGNDNTAKMWCSVTGVEIFTFSGHEYYDYVVSVAFSPDGRKGLIKRYGGESKMWDLATNSIIHTFDRDGYDNTLSFSPDGTKVLTGTALWDATTGIKICTFSGHTSYVNSAAFSPDGTKVLTGSEDATAKLWDATTGTEIHTFSGHKFWIDSVAFSPDGTKVLTGSRDSTAKLWDATTGLEIRTLSGHTSFVSSVAFSPDGKEIMTADGHDVRLWDSATTAVTRVWHCQDGVYVATFSPDGTKVLTTRGNYEAKIWDKATGAVICTFGGHTDTITSIAFSPDGTKVMTGSWDKTAKLWDAGLKSSETFLTDIPFGETTINQFLYQYQSRRFRFPTPAGGNLLVEITTGNPNTALACILRSPMAGIADDVVTNPASSGKYELLVSPTISGDYKVYVFNRSRESVQYTITPRLVESHLSDVSPRQVGNAESVTLTVRGVPMDQIQMLSLEGTVGTDIFAESNIATSARFNLTGKTPGFCDITADFGSAGIKTLSDCVEVLPGQGAKLVINLEAPQTVRRERKYAANVLYENIGDADMLAPIIAITSSDGTLLSLSPNGPFEKSSVWLIGTNAHYPVGILQAGTGDQISIYFIANSDQCRLSYAVIDSFDVSPDFASFSDYQEALSQAATRLRYREGKTIYDWSVVDLFARNIARGQALSAIRGSVINSKTKLPVREAVVLAQGPIEVNSISDSSGHFGFDNLPAGDYQLSVSGYDLISPVTADVKTDSDILGVSLFVQPLISPPDPPHPVPDVSRRGMVINTIQPWSGNLGGSAPVPYQVSLYNSGTQDVALNNWTLAGGDEEEVIIFPDVNLPSNCYLTIIFATGTDDLDFSDRSGTWHTGDIAWGLDRESGELGLYNDTPTTTSLVDFVAWGFDHGPQDLVYAHALAFGQWHEQDFISTKDYALFSLIMRLPSGYDRNISKDWQEFDPFVGMIEGPDNPQQIAPQNRTLHDSISQLEWRAVDGAAGYLIEVDDDEGFSSPIVSRNVTGTTTTLTLPDGYYYWRVIPELSGDPYPVTVWRFSKDGEVMIKSEQNQTNIKSSKVPDLLTVPILNQHKDTDMICLAKWKQIFDTIGRTIRPGCLEIDRWNKFHEKTYCHTNKCDHCGWYCPVASIRMIALKFHGSIPFDEIISQDEIIYRNLTDIETRPELDIGGHGRGLFPEETKNALSTSLQCTVVEKGKITWAELRAEILAGRPILAVIGESDISHVVVIDGALEVDTNRGFVRYADPWYGTHTYFFEFYSKYFNRFYLLSPSANQSPQGLRGDSRISVDKNSADSDNDGLCDFDEEVRFHTDPMKSDSDNDGVNDLSEIRAYTFYDRKTFIVADVDGDTKRAELDPDSDNDGDIDGAEDINGDGDFCDPGETDPFDKSHSQSNLLVERPVYLTGDRVYISSRSGTFRPNSTYSYTVSNTIKRTISSGEFTTDEWGYAKRTLVAVSNTEIGSFEMTATIFQGTIQSDTIQLKASWQFIKRPPETGTDISVIRSYDPNEKVGPIGKGAPDFTVSQDDEMAYSIYFENTTSATAAVQELTITDQLDINLDWGSFELGSFSFGGFTKAFDSGAFSDYSEFSVPLWKKNSRNEWVTSGTALLQVNSSIFAQTGLVQWYFKAVDPVTKDWLEDPFAGFLPPDNDDNRGEGYVTFKVRVRSDAAPRAVIKNKAGIVFDYNASIETNTVFNTVVDESPLQKKQRLIDVLLGKSIKTEGLDMNSDEKLDIADLVKMISLSSKRHNIQISPRR